MDSEIKNFIDHLKTQHLTAAERFEMRQKLLGYVAQKKVYSAQPSPYSPKVSPWQWLISSKMKASIAFVIIFCLAGSGIAWASQQALPGDVLYAVKTDVNENVLRAINSTSPTALADFETTIMEKRLVEAETLDKEKKLNPANEPQIQKAIATQEQRVGLAVAKLVDQTHDATSSQVALEATSSDILSVHVASSTAPQSKTSGENMHPSSTFSAQINEQTASTTTIMTMSLQVSASTTATTSQTNKDSDKSSSNNARIHQKNNDDAQKALIRLNTILKNHHTIINKINSDDTNHYKERNDER